MSATTDKFTVDDGCCTAIHDNSSGAENGTPFDYQARRALPTGPPKPVSKPRSPTAASADGGPLNYSSNVLLVYRLQEMRHMESVNFVLAVLCLVYCGINIALIIVNYVNSHNEGDPPVSEKCFHLIEFWATFVFAVVECVSLISTPKSLFIIYDNPLALRLVLFFNIVASSLPAVLISLNYEYFEILSHQVEYVNELTLSFVDVVLLWSLFKVDDRATPSLPMAVIASVVSLVQLAVYNGMGRTADGDMVGEVPAHYLEFSFGIISSVICGSFCLDNKFVCGKEIGEILYGTHRDCDICVANLNDYEGTYLKSRPNMLRYGSI